MRQLDDLLCSTRYYYLLASANLEPEGQSQSDARTPERVSDLLFDDELLMASIHNNDKLSLRDMCKMRSNLVFAVNFVSFSG